MNVKRRALMALMSLSACLSNPAWAQSTPALNVGCDWFLVYGPGSTTGNTAFPEANAHYWLAIISENVPVGARLRMEGKFPAARYSAFHVHNGSLEVIDSIADFRINPDPGNLNPFFNVTQLHPGATAGGAYTAFLRFHTPVPTTTAARQANTIYRPAPAMLDGVNRKRTVLSYRTYLKSGTLDSPATLPKLTLETNNGLTKTALSSATSDTAACAALRPSYQRENAGLYGSANLVDASLPVLRPVFKKYSGAAGGLLGAAVPTSTGTIGYNPQNGFLYIKTATYNGQLLLVRGLAPSYTTTTRPLSADPQVRYWSLCQYGFNSQKVVGCTADAGAKLDSRGYYNFVLSPDALKPPLVDVRGFNFQSWGPEAQGDVILRYLLEHPDFKESINQVPTMQSPAVTMKEYAPKATYCSSAVFAAAAAPTTSTPESIFLTCAASR